MRAKRVSRVIGRDHIPETIRSLSLLERPNYADMFTVQLSRPAGVSLEQWLRDVFEAGPVLVRLGVPVIQRRVLGLRLNQRPFAPGFLIGWKIAEGGDDWLRLEADSSLMTANIVGKVLEDQVSVATFVRYERPIAALVWPPVAVLHRQVALTLMLRAVALQDSHSRRRPLSADAEVDPICSAVVAWQTDQETGPQPPATATARQDRMSEARAAVGSRGYPRRSPLA